MISHWIILLRWHWLSSKYYTLFTHLWGLIPGHWSVQHETGQAQVLWSGIQLSRNCSNRGANWKFLWSHSPWNVRQWKTALCSQLQRADILLSCRLQVPSNFISMLSKHCHLIGLFFSLTMHWDWDLCSLPVARVLWSVAWPFTRAIIIPKRRLLFCLFACTWTTCTCRRLRSCGRTSKPQDCDYTSTAKVRIMSCGVCMLLMYLFRSVSVFGVQKPEPDQRVVLWGHLPVGAQLAGCPIPGFLQVRRQNENPQP